MEVPPTKRKSKFDILPEGFSNNPVIVNDIQQRLLELSNSVPLQEIQLPLTNWVSVTDLAHRTRLEKALLKNFDYIDRKDRGELKSAPTKAPNGESSAQMQKHHAAVQFQNLGIGAAKEPQVVETTSIYVAGLPIDITEEELGILFSARGSIKKIKIYPLTPNNRVRDALVTFAKAETVGLACKFFDKLDIGDGYVISVSKADFQAKTSNEHSNDRPLPSSAGTFLSSVNPSTSASSSATAGNREAKMGSENIRKFLPVECEVREQPVVLIQDAYDPQVFSKLDAASAIRMLEDLEADLLLECCKFGKIVRLLSPDDPSWLVGSVAVTFRDLEAARSCAIALDGRRFDGRTLKVVLFQPMSQFAVLDVAECKDETRSTIEFTNSDQAESKEGDVVDDVDDFLQSLL